jgi:hypothetical protein
VRADQYPAQQENNDLRNARAGQKRHHHWGERRHQGHGHQVFQTTVNVH